MLFGTMFHRFCEEAGKMGKRYTKAKILSFAAKYSATFRDPDDITLCRLALTVYFEYRKWTTTLPKVTYIDNEPVFDEKYTVPGTHWNPCPEISVTIPKFTIRLRGRIDEVIDKAGKMWIGETKTKGNVNASIIADTLHANLQVMVYALCSQLKFNRPCKGVNYNVIRKPGLRMRKGDTITMYLDRVTEDIQKRPDHYFMRFSKQFSAADIKKWEREEFHPLLYQLYIWWKSIEANPLHPWADEDGNANPFHGRKSFGVYDPMSIGKGDYYDLIALGQKRNLRRDYELFHELTDDDL